MTATAFHDWYYNDGTSRGYHMPRIAPYHTGPFRLAIMLQDPGGPLAGSGAQGSGEIGVRNADGTARYIRNELDHFNFRYSDVVLLNALPGYGLRNTVLERQRGAIFNNEAIQRAGIDCLLVAGKSIAWPVAHLMNLNSIKTAYTHHPSIRGHNACGSNVEGKRIWREALRSLLV
ncbi:hypothetical protein [Algirhabdus cladophorae]|uniref:hypothetical protein n=1 Tax=Algirhabdus cladophorae TaxID=3377108 RepID=UPI003B84A0B4